MELTHPQATISITPEADRPHLHRVRIEPNPGVFCAVRSAVTSYPVPLIQAILAAKGASHLCDEIRRDEDPKYVELTLRNDVLAYVPERAFAGARLLDFGCGAGASTAILGRMFPDCQITGAELEEPFVAIAQQRIAHHGLTNARVLQSPNGDSLPPDLGLFDFILLSAVWEHLLPKERVKLPALLWRSLKPGGVLFLNQTPYRWSPAENHTTGLPLLNYLPDGLALRVARARCPRIASDETWESLLRRGTRGGSVPEILRAFGPTATLLQPSQLGYRDRIDLWYGVSSAARFPVLKKAIRAGLKTLKALSGVVLLPTLSLALQKS